LRNWNTGVYRDQLILMWGNPFIDSNALNQNR
jgi:hypothetical protein